MEETGNIQKSPMPVDSQKERRKDIGVVVLNILLAVITIVLLGYIAYRNGYINLDNILNIQQEEEETTQEDGNDELINFAIQTYEGIHFNALTTLGWIIIEYYDGDGTSMMDTQNDSYTGLTGISIKDDDVEIMKIEGVSGIGFLGCSELPRFEDSDPEYEEMQEELNEQIGEEIQYLDYTNTPYSEFTWLEKRVRRIGAALYYDTIEGDAFFQAQCEVSFIRLEPLGFELSGGYKGDTYMYTISQDATEEQLEILDRILTSMVAN